MPSSKRAITDEYLKSRYGDHLEYFAEKGNYATAAELYPEVGYGECYREKHVEVQCNIIIGTGDGAAHIDPTFLTYEQKIAKHMSDFCNMTTAHGLPMIGVAENRVSKAFWIVLYLFCFGNFTYQAISVVEKYQRNEKIVDIQLVFESAPFPAITICNLNPYKKTSARHVSLVQRTLKAFADAMGDAAAGPGGRVEGGKRVKRSEHAIFEPANSDCTCTGKGVRTNCIANKETQPETEETLCLCAFDRPSGDAWPCYPKSIWAKEQCEQCDMSGYCSKGEEIQVSGLPGSYPCWCQSLSSFCVVAEPEGTEILNLWEFYGQTEPTEDPLFLEALGFAGMTDEVAIVTKGKENIMFAMSTLSMDERARLSSSSHELVQKCSFNGKQCDIDVDFKSRVDPIFGNCFTFNHNRSVTFTSIRAGPMYGLRILVYINASEYLPTTEATGVKLTIHEQEEYPFPDTFGYSAPTGSISSFGIKLRRMQRLPAPYGECVLDGKTKDYIYTDYQYSTEGCYRSCFQHLVLHECGCGDPRFPVMEGYHHCEAADPVARRCLDGRTKSIGTDTGVNEASFRCRCQQPCLQSTYSVSYSASVWPSESLQVQLGTCDDETTDCVQHYRKHAAMIEVFYEQLNYEMLRESEAYGWVNLLSDFGGQLGLWLGISIITCWELVFMLIGLLIMSARHHYEEWKAKRLRKKQGIRN